MYIVYADRHGDTPDSQRRQSFAAKSFTLALSPDGSSGTVVLEPDGRALRVGNADHGYSRIRIFDERGSLAGAMNFHGGTVHWTVPQKF